MKRKTNSIMVVISLGILMPLWAAETSKPSAWQRFKNIFSSKNSEQKNENQQESSNNKLGFLESLSDLYTQGRKFSDFSIQQAKMIQVKVDTLTLVQQEVDAITDSHSSSNPEYIFVSAPHDSPEKITKKKLLSEQLGRLRADLFMTFVEIFENIRPVIVSIKNVVSRGSTQETGMINALISQCDAVVLQGNAIGEKLLQASKAYGKRDAASRINAEVKILINKYFKSITKAMAMIQPVMNTFKKVVSIAQKALIFTNAITFGSVTTITAVFVILDKIVSIGQIAANLAKEIFEQIIKPNALESVKSNITTIGKEIENKDSELKTVKL